MKKNNIEYQQGELDALIIYSVPMGDLDMGLESKTYYLLHSEILTEGELRINVSWTERSGERLSGTEIVTSDHPKYETWKDLIENKPKYRNLQNDLTRLLRKHRPEG